jgi:hypothetical protein
VGCADASSDYKNHYYPENSAYLALIDERVVSAGVALRAVRRSAATKCAGRTGVAF